MTTNARGSRTYDCGIETSFRAEVAYAKIKLVKLARATHVDSAWYGYTNGESKVYPSNCLVRLLTIFAPNNHRLLLDLGLSSNDHNACTLFSPDTVNNTANVDNKIPSSKHGVRSKSLIGETGPHPSGSRQYSSAITWSTKRVSQNATTTSTTEGVRMATTAAPCRVQIPVQLLVSKPRTLEQDSDHSDPDTPDCIHASLTYLKYKTHPQPPPQAFCILHVSFSIR